MEVRGGGALTQIITLLWNSLSTLKMSKGLHQPATDSLGLNDCAMLLYLSMKSLFINWLVCVVGCLFLVIVLSALGCLFDSPSKTF